MNDIIFYTVAAGDDDLIETLLYESESSAIDFKRDQYPFAQASDEQKSELVKDILAMTNAWRRQVTAYILIGADEAKGGGKSFPVGISHHLDEASLQQLINSKTNRPVEFSYRAISFSGLSLGLIAIPPQPRPVFLVLPGFAWVKGRMAIDFTPDWGGTSPCGTRSCTGNCWASSRHGR